MKRRLFLKQGSLAASGLVAVPYLLTSCKPILDIVTEKPPVFTAEMAEGLTVLAEGAELMDISIAELRTSGNGELGPAVAEVFTLGGVAEQIYNQAEVQAEVPVDFAESAAEILDASAEIAQAAPELLIESETNPETLVMRNGGFKDAAEDFAFLKVLKATSILRSASDADPHNAERAIASENMFEAAETFYTSMLGENPAEDGIELIESSEHLLAYSEQYVGVCETFSGEAGFILGVENFDEATSEIAAGEIGPGAAVLLASSENIALSAEYFAEGVNNLEGTAELLGNSIENTAEELVPFAEFLVSESMEYMDLAKGKAAEIGAEAMLEGAEQILMDAETDAMEIYNGGETFELGAEKFIAGTMSFKAAEKYTHSSERFYQGVEHLAEGLAEGNARLAEAGEMSIMMNSGMLLSASEDYFMAAEAQEFLATNLNFEAGEMGVQDLSGAAAELTEGAEMMEAIPNPRQIEAELGAIETLEGAEWVTYGSIEVDWATTGSLIAEAENTGETFETLEPQWAAFGSEELNSGNVELPYLEDGAESIVTGTGQIHNGAMEFIEGLER